MLLSACSTSHKDSSETSASAESHAVTYSGILPAADAEGVRYILTLDYDDDGSEGDFKLAEVYLSGGATRESGSDSLTFRTTGDFQVLTGTPQSATQKYIKLVPENDTSDANSLYFVIDSDSTITMVSSSLTPAVSSDLNYTLTKQ